MCLAISGICNADIHAKQIAFILQQVHCNALWGFRNFLGFETYTYTKRLYETLTCASFVYIALDKLLNSQKWTHSIISRAVSPLCIWWNWKKINFKNRWEFRAKITHIFLIAVSNMWHCFPLERRGGCKTIDIFESDKSDFYIHIKAHTYAYRSWNSCCHK